MSGAGSRDERADEPRWRYGDQILWTYTNPAHPGLYDQRPVTVIADDENHLAVWLESGTRMLHQVLADGSGIRTADGPARFGAPRAQGLKRLQGPGIVAVFQPGADYSVWFFENPDSARRDSFYVNLEEPFTRFDRGILTSDHVLDIVVDSDGTYRLKDEDELEFARRAGMFSPTRRPHASAQLRTPPSRTSGPGSFPSTRTIRTSSRTPTGRCRTFPPRRPGTSTRAELSRANQRA